MRDLIPLELPATGPQPFDIIIHNAGDFRGLSGLCIGFERGIWRCKRFSEYIFNFLPEFSLNWSERQKINDANAVELLRTAARKVFLTEKYERRGEFGELILHVLLNQIFGTEPAISKIFYKDSPNDTVKGFDAVHVVSRGGVLELWLGEAKFYSNISDAIHAVVKDLNEHSKTDYLRIEFALICNKIDPSWEHADRLIKLLDPNTSLDVVFSRTCIPVLITYDSETVRDYDKLKEDYRSSLRREIFRHYETFLESGLPKDLKIHLFLLPLKSKREVQEELQERLKACQRI